ncbi:MAG TPA: oligosaccharide flippase family protein [Patescibacteria group bacterium]|nr:oligosaccharide flippase family protein [Patescibacteria group bacterium]
MEEIDIALIKKKSLSGIVALTSQTFLLQLIAFGATLLLTIFLTPTIFGIFYVVSAIINFLQYFADIGLAAALIQKKEPLTPEDLSTTFTIQQLLVFPISIITFAVAPLVAAFYKLDAAGVMLLRALVVSFFISSLKTIPSILLERNLEFKKLVIPQIVETIGFYLVAVIMAWKGFGITSFTWAVCVRAVVGLIVIYIISPWRIQFGISKPVAKKLLRFGIPFQMNSFLALLKDDLMTVFLGKILPFAQVGYIGWAKKWAEVPLRLIMDSVIQVTFPAFSRLQHSKEMLGKAIEKTLFGLATTIIPISVGLLFFVQPAVFLIPKYGKWEPALVSFFIFVISAIIAGLSTPLTNALNAVGQIKITMMLMIFWTVATWILTITLIHFIGFNGFAVGLLIQSLTIFIVVKITQRFAAFSFVEYIKWPVLAGLLQGALYYVARGSMPYSIPRLVIVAGAGVILYGGVVWVKQKERILDIIHISR